MKIIKSFKCTTGHKFERLVESNKSEATCWCKAKAVKILSANKFIGNSCGKNASWS